MDTPEKLTKELQKAEKERDEYLAGWQRAKADFANYKKEIGERMQYFEELIKTEQIMECLPVLDNLELAASKLSEKQRQDAAIKGFLHIIERFRKMLRAQNIEEIKAVGKKFDPALHEAIEEVKEGRPGIVIEEVQKGYMRSGKLLRPTKVRVGK